MKRTTPVAVVAVLICLSLATGATEVGVRVAISYNPNLATTSRAMSPPVAIGMTLYGEFGSDRWTGTADVGISFLRQTAYLSFSTDYAVAPGINAKARLTFTRTATETTAVVLSMGAVTRVYDGAFDIWVGSMPVGITLMRMLGRQATTVLTVPNLFAVADWTTPGGVRLRERIDVVLTPLTHVMIQQSLPPDRMWENVGIGLTSTTSAGFR